MSRRHATRWAAIIAVSVAAVVPAACGGDDSVDTAAFCKDAEKAMQHLQSIDPSTAGSVANELKQLAAEAPDEVKADVAAVAAYTARLDSGGSSDISDSEDEASTKMASYLDSNCS